ncbi:MAG: ribonuclease III domain-containing protein [Candidatus Lokiarchaeia archaeon]
MITLENWLKKLQVREIDLGLMETAFAHRSYKGLGYAIDDYERLEFLGDTVIDLIVSDKFYNIGQYSEGDLTELRSLLVKEKPLAELFDKMEMSPLVRRAGVSLSPGMKSDVVEAFFAVIYLEKGIKKCREVWDIMMEKTGVEEEVINNYLIKGKEELKGLTQEQIKEREGLLEYYALLKIKTNQNAKNVLQQLFQKEYKSPDLLPDYNDFDKEGPANEPTFTVRLNESISIRGKTYKLKVKEFAGKQRIAEIKAAEKACDLIYLRYNKI